jgi:hypothetical protein
LIAAKINVLVNLRIVISRRQYLRLWLLEAQLNRELLNALRSSPQDYESPRIASSGRGPTLTRKRLPSLILLFVFVSSAFIPIPKLCIIVSL